MHEKIRNDEYSIETQGYGYSVRRWWLRLERKANEFRVKNLVYVRKLKNTLFMRVSELN